MQEIVYLEPMNKKLIKDILFALQLGLQVITSFTLAIIIGLYLDDMLNSKPIILLVLLLLAFIYVITLLLGAGKHE